MYRVGLFFIFGLMASGARADVCGSVDVRNYVHQLNKLQNCTEIAGTLFIVLIETTKSEADFEPYVFPKLQKVSEYVVVYKVKHLTSLGKLFPNLRLIRGLNLLMEYSLVLYNLPNLQEIGTTKLTSIARGYVKLGRVPKLCYSDTIDWSRIGKSTVAVYQKNRKDCPGCPASCNGYCWNEDSCQTFTDQCHEECLGCTKNQSNTHCDVCKNFEDNGACVPECPPNKYALHYLGKCVTKDECLYSTKPTKALNKLTWFIHARACLTECPEETHFNNETKECTPCYNECVKWCAGTKIMSEVSAQSMRGCTHINGSVAILSLMGSLQKTGLYKYLKHVRYIKDYLLISRNDVIEDLKFLPSLKEIGGEKLYAGKSLMVFENRNLKSLWDSDVSLVIKNGNIGFHDNEQLCLSQIEKFAQQNRINYTENDVSQYSNGADCAESVDNKLQVIITQYRSDGITLTWENRSENQILYYTVYYTDSPKVSQSDPDVCSKDGWLSFSTGNTSAQLTGLDTFQTYYYYITMYHKNRTITRTRERYFKTLANDPRQPENFRAIVLNSTAVVLKWGPPEQTYGSLSEYRISIYKEPPNQDIPNQRNYCQNGFTVEGEQTDPWEPEPVKLDSKIKNQLFYQQEAKDEIFPQPNCSITDQETNFKLENHVWLHLCHEKSLTRFGIDDCRKYYYPESLLHKRSIEYTQYTAINVNATTNVYTVTNLEPFSLYIFYLMACNEENYGKPLCSAVLQTMAKTSKNETNDLVTDLKIENPEQLDMVITWTPPTKPNGLVVGYNLYIGKRKNDLKNQKFCVGHNVSEVNVTAQESGLYKVAVQTITLAGECGTLVNAEIRVTKVGLLPIIASAIVSVMVVMAIITCLRLYFRNHRLYISVNPDYHSVSYRSDPWELRRDDLELYHLLGQGSFGTVYRGRIKSRNMDCAIKTVKEDATEELISRFLEEAHNMKDFTKAPHVVKLYGMVIRGMPPMVAMELMDRGDLKKYLKKMRNSPNPITCNEIYRMAIEIADGLAFLATKKFVHRDLAARNCMVAVDRTVKIGDFGLARDIYVQDYYKKGAGNALLPMRWMAPESIGDGVYTYDSDIWSYGIVLWEIATLAEQPYPGLTNEQVRQFVLNQGKPNRPKSCPNLLWEIMEECWEWHPMQRPTCFQIIERLQDNVSENFKSISFYHSEVGQHLVRNVERLQTVPAMVGSSNLIEEPVFELLDLPTTSHSRKANVDEEPVFELLDSPDKIVQAPIRVMPEPDPDYVPPSSPVEPPRRVTPRDFPQRFSRQFH